MILYRQKYFGEDDENRGMGWGKKLALGIGTAAALGYGAKKGYLGASAQVTVNKQLGKMGGFLSNSRSETLRNLGDKTMKSAGKDLTRGYDRITVARQLGKVDSKLTGDALAAAQKSATRRGHVQAIKASRTQQAGWKNVGKPVQPAPVATPAAAATPAPATT